MNRHGSYKVKKPKNEHLLALTLTYKKHNYVEPLAQFQDTIFEVQYLLARCCKFFEIFPELTVDGKIHYHILLELKDRIKWYKKVLPKFKRNGFVCVKYADEKWKTYCLKCKEEMEELLECELPISHENKVKKPHDECCDSLDDAIGILKYYHTL